MFHCRCTPQTAPRHTWRAGDGPGRATGVASRWSGSKGWDGSFVHGYSDLSPYAPVPRLPSTWYHPRLPRLPVSQRENLSSNGVRKRKTPRSTYMEGIRHTETHSIPRTICPHEQYDSGMFGSRARRSREAKTKCAFLNGRCALTWSSFRCVASQLLCHREGGLPASSLAFASRLYRPRGIPVIFAERFFFHAPQRVPFPSE